MKIFNLVIAIVYTLFLVIMAVSGAMAGDSDLVIGTIMLALPVVSNWLSFYYWDK